MRWARRAGKRHPEVRAVFGEPRRMCDRVCGHPSRRAKSAHLRMRADRDAIFVIPGRCEASNPESRDSGFVLRTPRNDGGYVDGRGRMTRNRAAKAPSKVLTD